MRLNNEHLTDAAYRHFRNPSPEIQTALLEARNTRLIQFRTEWFPTIFGEESLQARESYDDDPTTFLKSISYAAEQSSRTSATRPPPRFKSPSSTITKPARASQTSDANSSTRKSQSKESSARKPSEPQKSPGRTTPAPADKKGDATKNPDENSEKQSPATTSKDAPTTCASPTTKSPTQ